MSNVVSMTVPESVINTVVKEEISRKIVEALSGNDALVRQIVHTTMITKVNDQGVPYARNDYGHDRAPSYLEWLCSKTIRAAAEKAMIEYITNHEEPIRKAIEAEMKKSSATLAKGVVDSIAATAKCRYSFKIEVAPGKD